MDGATTTSTGSNNSAPGVNNSNVASSFLNLGSLGSNQAVVGGMGLFSSGVGGGEGLGSSFGTSFGNGFTNDSGSANPSFDLNDFPSLGGGAASGAGSTVSAGNDNGLAAALRQQQQLLQQQMMQGGISAVDKSSNLYRLAMSSGIANGATNNFNMTTEDFPALGTSGDVGGHTEGGSTLDTESLTTGSGGILDSGGSNQLDYTGLIGSTGVTLSSIQQGSQPRVTSTGTQSGSGGLSSAAVGSSGNSGSGGGIGGDYGLLGLLSVIRMTDADRNRLALGSDLTVLGLNLNSPDVLHSTFGGPFSDKPATKDPHYQVR
jgi:CCR4-NOT transcription complex subunit 2